MADFKLSDGKTTHPPDLPLSGNELLFGTQERFGQPVTVVFTTKDLQNYIRPKNFRAVTYFLSQI